MKTLLLCSCLLPLLAVSCAPATSSAPTDCRLTVDLRDGSRVVGAGMDKQLVFTSTILGEVKLPLDKIRFVEALPQTNQVRLTTAGGDSLAVRFDMEQVRVKTTYGEVKLPVALIKSVRVSRPGGVGLPTDGLIGLWSGNGNAVDSVGGNNGVMQNIRFTDGVAGQAFSFSPNSYPYGTFVGVLVADEPAYALTNALTIEGWIRPRGDGYTIMSRGDHRPGFDPYTLSMQANHDLRFLICGQNNEAVHVDADVPYCRWTHVAAVFDGDNRTISLYTNGMLAAQAETQIRPLGALIQNLSPGLGIGNLNQGGINFPFIGDIDEIALYDRALSPEEISASYAEHAADAGGTCEPLPSRPSPASNFFWQGSGPAHYSR